MARDPRLAIEDTGPAGAVWTFHVGLDEEHEPIITIIRHGPTAIRAQIEHARGEENAPDLSSIDMTVQLLLGSRINESALALIWEVFVQDFSGIPFDEMDGFEASL